MLISYIERGSAACWSSGVFTCAAKNIFSQKNNSSYFIYGNGGEESGDGKGKGVCEQAGIEQG